MVDGRDGWSGPGGSGCLLGLVARLRADGSNWDALCTGVERWLHSGGLDARALGDDLAQTSGGAILRRSRETTTHFAWCIVDQPTDPFSVWINEYKPAEHWLPGYADSVHNHRYHFCTTHLSGSYVHEVYAVAGPGQDGGPVSVDMRSRERWFPGAARVLMSDAFHRVVEPSGCVLTLLVKSRPVADFSLSIARESGQVRRHVPVEARLPALIDKLRSA